MDSVPLEMDDIFGEYEGEGDDEGFNPSRLPDLEDELEPMRDMMQAEDNQGDEEDDGLTDNAELLAKLKSMKGASKNTTKRTMPKLDAARLTGERGIGVVPKVFERVPLKGRNHEAQDLKVMMHTLQHWGHRLFPKMTFDEVLERVERLGAKKEVQCWSLPPEHPDNTKIYICGLEFGPKTCLKKIRLDMPVLQSDMVGEEEDTVHRAGDDDADDNARDGDPQETECVNDSHNEISDSELDDLLRDQGEPVANASTPVHSQDLNPPRQSESSGLSSEVRKKIEENKRKAMERRAAKLAASNKKTDVSSDADKIPLDSSRNMSMDEESDDVNICQDSQESDGDISKMNKRSLAEESHSVNNSQTERLQSNSEARGLNEDAEPFQINDVELPMSPEYGPIEVGDNDSADPSVERKTSEQPLDGCLQTKNMHEAQLEDLDIDTEHQEKHSEATECTDNGRESL